MSMAILDGFRGFAIDASTGVLLDNSYASAFNVDKIAIWDKNETPEMFLVKIDLMAGVKGC